MICLFLERRWLKDSVWSIDFENGRYFRIFCNFNEFFYLPLSKESLEAFLNQDWKYFEDSYRNEEQ